MLEMPTQRIILFGDNKREFLDTRAEFLLIEGYHVVKVYTLDDATRLLNDAWFHLAILDVRFVDDDDPTDVSGLVLAQQEKYRHMPKVILTDFPSSTRMREAIGPRLDGLPPAVSYIAKTEKPDDFVAEVKRAFDNFLRLNWDLTLDWRARDRFSLAHLIEPDLNDERLPSRADEFIDLFRKTFYDYTHLRIERLLWHRDGRVALVVFASKHSAAPESFVVICEARTPSASTSHNVQPSIGTRVALSPDETTHFMAHVYALDGANLEEARSLRDIYRANDQKLFRAALADLYDNKLAAWHKNQRFADTSLSLAEWYRRRFKLDASQLEKLEARIGSLIAHVPALGLSMARSDGTLTLHFERQQPHTYADPIERLRSLKDDIASLVLMNSPSNLWGDTILADPKGHVWLTDFRMAESAPLFWSYLTLEAAIRYDWITTKDLRWLHGMERQLSYPRSFAKPDSDGEVPVRQAIQMIQSIREAATKLSIDPQAYLLGMLFQAASRLRDSELDVHMLPGELARMAHLLISMAVTAGSLADYQKTPATAFPEKLPHIEIDRKNQTVKIAGEPKDVSGQGFELLCYMDDKNRQLCTRRELVEKVLKGRFDEKNNAEDPRLNTAMRRLREKIEPDPKNPHYIIGRTGLGYELRNPPP